MTSRNLLLAAGFLVAVAFAAPAVGPPGGGGRQGGRPAPQGNRSMPSARPGMVPQARPQSRPTPQPSRPAQSRPTPQPSRPAQPRPTPPVTSRPGIVPGNRPSVPQRPSIQQPTTRPSQPPRPAIQPPTTRPSPIPGRPPGSIQGAAGGGRPPGGNQGATGNSGFSVGGRPTAGIQGASGNAGISGGGRPPLSVNGFSGGGGGGVRPGSNNGAIANAGFNGGGRPPGVINGFSGGGGVRPPAGNNGYTGGIGGRPTAGINGYTGGNAGYRPPNWNRPNNNNTIVNNNNVNNNFNNVNTRSNWNGNYGYNRQNWNGNYGYNHQNWNGNYGYNRPRYPYYGNWYHGAWNNWSYRPNCWVTGFATGAILAPGIATYAFSNPYYVVPPFGDTIVYNYSQPIQVMAPEPVVVEVPVEAPPALPVPTAPAPQSNYTPPAADDPKVQAALKYLDSARAVFKTGDYGKARTETDQAIGQVPGDPVLHEFRALTLFAEGKYRDAAGVVYSVLATGPGMDWATMKSMYPDVKTYGGQIDKLQAYIRANPTDPSAQFLLAYHCLVLDEKPSAVIALQKVVDLNPEDKLAADLLGAIKQQVNTGGEKPTIRP